MRLSGTNYVKAQANSEANAEAVGIVSVVADADNFSIQTFGRITGLSGLTAGAVYYLDDDTAGLLTSTEPPDAGDVSKPLLIADTTTSGWIFNMRGFIQSDASASAVRVQLKAVADTTVLTTGDGKTSFWISAQLNGYNLTGCSAAVVGVSSSGTPTVQLRRVRAGSPVDMLSTAITIDVSELDSTTAATPPAINGSNDDVATGDRIFVDVDVAGTGTDGLDVELVFSRP